MSFVVGERVRRVKGHRRGELCTVVAVNRSNKNITVCFDNPQIVAGGCNEAKWTSFKHYFAKYDPLDDFDMD